MTPFAARLAQMGPPPRLWRIAAGVLVIALTYFLWNVGIGGVLWLLSGMDGLEAHLRRLESGASPLAMALLFSTFLGFWLGTWLAMRLLHGRGLGAVIGRAPEVLRDFALGVLAMVLVGGVLTLAMIPMLPPLEMNLDPGTWALLLPLALLGVLVQTGAEEVAFRGYLQGQLARRFASALVWMGVPTVLFGLAHYNPGAMGGNVWLVVAATGLFGLIASDLTARSGNLGLAWGLHFANNVLAILVVSLAGGLDGLALLRPAGGVVSEAELRPLLIADMLLLVAVWASCRIWLRRR